MRDRQVLGILFVSCGLAPVGFNDARMAWGSGSVGRRRHFSSVCHPGWLQLVEKPPLGVFLAPCTPACLPTFLPACTTAWCSHNTPGTRRLIFYLKLAYTLLAATHTYTCTQALGPEPVNFFVCFNIEKTVKQCLLVSIKCVYYSSLLTSPLIFPWWNAYITGTVAMRLFPLSFLSLKGRKSLFKLCTAILKTRTKRCLIKSSVKAHIFLTAQKIFLDLTKYWISTP